MSKRKRIGIMTTGGDCSGLNTAIQRIMHGCAMRGWDVVGVVDGTDGLYNAPVATIELTRDVLPLERAHISGSILGNGHDGVMNFEKAASTGKLHEFNKKLHDSIAAMNLDTMILIGGNGSMSLAWAFHEIYAGVKLVCIPKTIDMDIPLTDVTIGFDTAVQQLTYFCDQLLMSARSHHRWFVVQSMGRDCGKLALNAGVAVGADAILIPEIKFDVDNLIQYIKNSSRDYGIIIVSEGISLRGHSGRAADMISRQLTAAGIPNRAEFPSHFLRAGNTTANDRIIATSMAECALRAIENNETYVMTAMHCGACETVSLEKFFNSGDLAADPHIPGVVTANAYVMPDDPLLHVAIGMGTYIGEIK